MPNPDALQEFSVQTNNFSAEFGRQAGGVVNAITKSGTNELHGSAFEFVRNKAMNARPFFSPVVNGERRDDGLKRNQFGATLGGPVLLPKLYNGRDKTFFFVSYQGTLGGFVHRMRSSGLFPPKRSGAATSLRSERLFVIPFGAERIPIIRFRCRTSARLV